MEKKDVIKEFGQLFILAFDGPVLSRELIEFFNTFRIGGLIFFADNYQDPAQFLALTKEIQRTCAVDGWPLFITTDHEGGVRQEFKNGLTILPPLSVLGQHTTDHTYKLHQQIARELKNIGINLNLAPVADICEANEAGSIGNRSFGNNVNQVSDHVIAAIEGLQQGGILSCVKHFPGHGATRKNSHEELPMVKLSWKELEAAHLVPFKKAIEKQVSAVMTSHILFPDAGDARLPASLSAFWTTDVLRRQLGFEGLIITDALEMKALTNQWSNLDCGKMALQAGADLLIYYREKNQFQTFYELRMAAERGAFDYNKLAESINRVKSCKRKIQLHKL